MKSEMLGLIAVIVVAPVIGLAAGCSGDDGATSLGTGGEGGAAGSTSSATASATITTGAGNTTTSSTGMATTSATSTGMTTGTGGGDCPPDPTDDACEACVKVECCDATLACAADDNCVCWVGCTQNGGDIAACLQMCGAPTSTTTDFGQCAQGQGPCAADCSMP